MTNYPQALESDFQHLVLLVGTNPLPPFVVASWFIETLMPRGQLRHVWLVYSEIGPQKISNFEQAWQLKRALEARFELPINLFPVNEIGTATAIQRSMIPLAQSLQGQRVHLNFSGGTKAMALHSYRVLKQRLNHLPSFSYLDRQNFGIVSDIVGLDLQADQLRQDVGIQLDELIALQGFTVYAPFPKQVHADFLPALEVFDQLLARDALGEFWGLAAETMGWGQLRDALMRATSGIHQIEKTRYLRLFRKQLDKNWLEFRQSWKKFTASAAFHEVLVSLPELNDVFCQDDPPLPDLLNRLYSQVRFLDGQWLEMHTFLAVSAVVRQLELKADLGMALELRPPNWNSYFQMDVATLIGYQLMGISCTSFDSKAACKHKAFEMIHRVLQLGGDEVDETHKVMLVTCLNATEKAELQDELAFATGRSKANLLVCGLADLPQAVLQPQIRAFLTLNLVKTDETHLSALALATTEAGEISEHFLADTEARLQSDQAQAVSEAERLSDLALAELAAQQKAELAAQAAEVTVYPEAQTQNLAAAVSTPATSPDTAQPQPISVPASVLALVSDPDFPQDLRDLLPMHSLQIYSDLVLAFEAICHSEFIPDVILLQLPEEEAQRFCQLIHEDRYLALIPIVLVYDNVAMVEPDRLMSLGPSELLARNWIDLEHYPQVLPALIAKHQFTRQHWWEPFHIHAAEYPDKLLQKLKAGRSHVVRPILVESRDSFQNFKQFFYQRCGLLPDRIKYLPDYGFEQVYQLGDELYQDALQTAEAMADFLDLKLIESFAGCKLLPDALPMAFCQRNLVVPLMDACGKEQVVVSNPFQMEVVDILNRRFKSPRLMLAAPRQIEDFLNPDAQTENYQAWQAEQQKLSRPPVPTPQATEQIKLPEISHSEPVIPAEGLETGTSDQAPLWPSGLPTAESLLPEQEQVFNERDAQLMEQRLFRAYQAYRAKKQSETMPSDQMAAMLASDSDPEVAPIIHLVNSLIEKAHLMGASDIHIEPWENEVVVRYRIDGQLRVMHRLNPQAIIKPLITRIKIMSQLDIAEKRLPQDGKIPFSMFSPGEDINLRVSIVPMRYGERATMRLLDSRRGLVPLTRLGMGQAALALYHQKIKSPYGMILHVGPSGSGKTTTLYAALAEINSPNLNISTIENPIEYNLPGVNQLEIRHDIGLDFARVLRAYLRQDPDVVLVGEIRDEETAHIATEAAMTGHLLFSTLHTHDAASTIIRMMEMGIRPYMISSSLQLICAQRLLRRLCHNCRRPYAADTDVKSWLQVDPEQPLQLYAAVGCEHCNESGYSGRVGVYELLVLNDRLRRLMNQPGITADQLKQSAMIDNQMVTLFQGGVEKVIEGITSIEELILKLLPDEKSLLELQLAGS